MNGDQPTQGLVDTMSRLLTDEDFREQLLAEPETTLDTLGLAPSDREFIMKVARQNPEVLRAAAEDREGVIVATWGVFHIICNVTP